jgi:hypothetical protein
MSWQVENIARYVLSLGPVHVNFAKLPLGSDILLSSLCSSVEVVVCTQTESRELSHSRPSCETLWNLWHLWPYMVSIGSCTQKTGFADVPSCVQHAPPPHLCAGPRSPAFERLLQNLTLMGLI